MSKESAPARTRGGWEPSGTAAARRSAHGERVTAKGRAPGRNWWPPPGASSSGTATPGPGWPTSRPRPGWHTAASTPTSRPSRTCSWPWCARWASSSTRPSPRPPAGRGADPYQALDQANRRYLAAYRANSVIWALVEQVSTVDPEIHRIRLLGPPQARRPGGPDTIRRWQDRGLADRDVDPETTAGALVSMISNFAYWWLAGGDSYDARPPRPP